LLKVPDIRELIDKKKEQYCLNSKEKICVELAAVAELPTEFGKFQVVAFFNNKDGEDHLALVHGDVSGKEDVPVRLHSECLTGDALGSLRCDCRQQLIVALKKVASMESGVVLYLRQEGRGIGLLNKMKAYQLQDFGYDTVEANNALGFRDDERDYTVAALMLKLIEVRSIKLITNNQKKIDQLSKHGIKVTGRIPILIEPNDYNRKYLKTKMEKSGHMLDDLFETG
jgi:GTP cyclohydrolase II